MRRVLPIRLISVITFARCSAIRRRSSNRWSGSGKRKWPESDRMSFFYKTIPDTRTIFMVPKIQTMITKIGTVGVYVEDQEKALKFWTEKVGFVEKDRKDMG